MVFIPNERENDAKYKIKSFDNLSELVYRKSKYKFSFVMSCINRFVLRSNKIPLKGIYLAVLSSYSIEDDYIDKIKNIIEINDFHDLKLKY